MACQRSSGGSGSGFAQEDFELGEGLFDGIFIDEHQALGVKPGLPVVPATALGRHVSALLFAPRAPFLSGIPEHKASC